jgi:hypothetical protein
MSVKGKNFLYKIFKKLIIKNIFKKILEFVPEMKKYLQS